RLICWGFFLILLFNGVESKVTICLNLTQEQTQSLTRTDILNKFTDEMNNWIFVEHADFNFTHPAISAKGTLDNLNISNILNTTTSLDYDYAEEDNEGANFTFSLTNVSIVGEYNLTGDIGDLFDIFGAGSFWLNLQITIIAIFNAIGDESSICVPLDISIELPVVDGHLDNFMNPYKNDTEFEDLMNKAIINLAPLMVEEFVLEFKNAFDDEIQEYFNCRFNYNCHNETTMVPK
ncbi:unnamed protein product, partial [Brassicogethes aeneus]